MRFIGPILFVLCLEPLTAPAQLRNPENPNPTTGKGIYQAACAVCHGQDGKGAGEAALGFEKPASFPDFTECAQTARETNVDWRATIRDGGHARAFSRIMPSFSEALNASEIDLVVAYLRGFCRQNTWPRGELNLPRALATEKAFPEDEVASTATVNMSGKVDVTNELIYERRFGARNELELSIPFGVEPYNSDVLDRLASRTGLKLTYGGRKGLGDAGIGVKRMVFGSLRSGSAVSAQVEMKLPMGPDSARMGSGLVTFEGSVSYGQLLPASFFVQTQAGTEQTIRAEIVPGEMYWRTAIGRSYRQEAGVGRIWSPMLELLASRDMVKHPVTSWDVMPEIQVSLSRRQHVRASVGIRYPVTHIIDRSPQLVFCVIWDWFDGKLREGWQ